MEENYETSGAKIVHTIKFTFPSLRLRGGYYTLDGKNLVLNPIYSKYANSVSDLLPEEKDYQFRIDQVNLQHKVEMEGLVLEIERLNKIIESKSRDITRLKTGTLNSIKFRR